MFIFYQATKECINKDVWLLDNKCSNHMTGSKELFPSLDNSINFEIKFGYDHLLDNKCIVTILNKKNETKDISEVYYV